MEIRNELRRVPTRPMVLVIAFLSTLALALTGWYVVASQPAHPGAVITSGFPGPDANDRNQQIQQSQQKDPESTHGH